MKVGRYIWGASIVFSRWTRLSYAVFRSIGKAVQIARLQFDLHKDLFEQKAKLESLNTDQEALLYQENDFLVKDFFVCSQTKGREENILINKLNII